MLIRKIKYTDFLDNEREEEFYFNLSKSEIIKWLTTEGGYTIDAVLQKMIETENVKDLVGTFESLIMMSYGERSLDGKSFIKSEEVKEKFRYSAAYDALFMELVGDAKKAAEFFNGICPPDLAQEVDKIMKENPESLPENLRNIVPTQIASDENKVTQMPTPSN